MKMTAADYNGLVDYLNRPEHYVLSDWPDTKPVLPEDADWPAPRDYIQCQLLVDRLPLFQRAVCMDVAVDFLTERGIENVLRYSFPEMLRMVSDEQAARWWSRCRARLAFVDAATAELS